MGPGHDVISVWRINLTTEGKSDQPEINPSVSQCHVGIGGIYFH